MFSQRIRNKTVALITLLAFISSCLPLYANANNAASVAPNLMVIFGNSYSMNRELDDVTYPAITTEHFNDIALGGKGTEFPYPAYGDQPSSKLYVAKQALTSVLNSTASDNINLGFATFRQSFGMEAASTSLTTRGAWPELTPNEATALTGSRTTQEKTDYGNDASNFKSINWYRIWVSGSRAAQLGKNASDDNKGVIDDAKTTYASGISIPTTFTYKPGSTPAYDLDPVTSDIIYSPMTTIHDLTYIDNATYGSSSVFISTGATGNLQVVTGSNPLVTWHLCNTYYDSQNNQFKATYLADKDIIDSYPTRYGSYSLTYIDWDARKFDASGTTSPIDYSMSCLNNFTGLYREATQRIANTYKSDNSRVWFSGIPHYYSGEPSSGLAVQRGVLSGWSGETTYIETNNAQTTGTMTANYPAGVANPDRADRQLITKGWQQTNAMHMGVFLDLPAPNLGYVDKRSLIKNFMGLQQMSQSGLDYDPTTQMIANNKGIAASTYAWDSHQSPIYDSLHSALAYFTAYKAADPYKNCRSNNILLFFDGKEDAHWVEVNGTYQYLSPADIATKLKAIGVHTYVVILSNNAGDISAANAIAAAGGTSSAYSANSAATLLSAFSSIFSGLSGPIKTAAMPTMPAQIGSAGGKLYQASYTLPSTVAGHLIAYSYTNNGFVDNTKPLWDAASQMTVTDRSNKLLSNEANGTIVNFNALDDTAFGIVTAPLTVPIIKSYTIEPSTNGGVYLKGRAQGSLLGMFGDSSMTPLLVPPPSNLLLDASDNNYKTFETAEADRKTSVLFQNDDGFLYAIDADTGGLLWGWMPRFLVSELQNYTSFWSSGSMKGGAVVADAFSDGVSYKSYVLGTAKGGAVHYALALKTNSNKELYPESVAWVNSVTGATSALAQAPLITYQTTSGTTTAYANYIKTVGTISTFYIHEIGVGKAANSIQLSFTASSELIHDNGFFYVADTDGNVWKMPVSSDPNTSNLNKVKIGETYNKQPAKWLGVYKSNTADYVWASGAEGITVFAYMSSDNQWKTLWESHIGGAGRWDASGSNYTAESVVNTIPSASSIQQLPIGSTITARAVTVKTALLLPVSVPNPTDLCFGIGYYYLFDMSNGFKPSIRFYKVNTDGTTALVTDNLYAGVGDVMQGAVSKATMGFIIEASANQTDSYGNGITATYLAKTGTSGLVSWREVTN